MRISSRLLGRSWLRKREVWIILLKGVVFLLSRGEVLCDLRRGEIVVEGVCGGLV